MTDDTLYRITCRSCGDQKKPKLYRELCPHCASTRLSTCRSLNHDVSIQNPRAYDFQEFSGVRRITGGRA